jgi:hypothetical protein
MIMMLSQPHEVEMTTDISEFYAQDSTASSHEPGDDPTLNQLAQATSSETDVLSVALPQNAQRIVVPVTGGQTVVLPTADENGLLAELGPEGNLGIVVDGRTIVLQGYVQAQADAPITIVPNDGDVVNITEVIADTDPNLDIQTAAGPASGPQGDSDVGNGIYTPFAAGPPLGGLDASGVLGATALAYGLVDNRPFVDTNEVIDDDFTDSDEPGDPGEPGEPDPNAPNAGPDLASVQPSPPADFQLMLIIDVSESMGEQVTRPDGTTTTRMELQKAAIAALLDAYVASTDGTVTIKAVTFSADAAYFGGTSASTFVDVSDPGNMAAFVADLQTLQPQTNTDYDAALSVAQQGIMDASWVTSDADTHGYVYFFSDGRPTESDKGSPYPGGSADNMITTTEESLWEGRTSAGIYTSGLADKGVVSLAIGQGEDVSGDSKALEQLGRVAYTSEANQDGPVIVVSDENQLTVEIVKTAPATTTGNVLGNDDAGPDGYAAPPIINIAAVLDLDTTSQTVTTTATGYEIETNNGVLTIDKTTGDFIYTAAPGGSGHSDTFTYTIQDAIGGETDSTTLTINIGTVPAQTLAAVTNAADIAAQEANAA